MSFDDTARDDLDWMVEDVGSLFKYSHRGGEAFDLIAVLDRNADDPPADGMYSRRLSTRRHHFTFPRRAIAFTPVNGDTLKDGDLIYTVEEVSSTDDDTWTLACEHD